MKKANRFANFFFEIGTMRRLPRMHRQTLIVNDSTDTIAAHSYRVTMIGWTFVKLENVDPYTVTMMWVNYEAVIKIGSTNGM